MSDSSKFITSEDNTYSNMTDNIAHNTYDSVQPGELDSLISILREKYENRDDHIRSVKYPKLLISSLIELRNLVGMDRLKDSIALQVMRLIDGAKNGEKSGRMLNTILYGPPGVGKTKVGIILAKIWYALGYLKKPSPSSGSATGSSPSMTYVTSENSNLGPILVTILIVAFTYIISGIGYIYNKWGFLWLIGLVFIVFTLLILLYWNKDRVIKLTEVSLNDKNIKQMNDRDLIKVVSRQDFVAEYLGQTAPKTKALLQANLGKVLFVDEAYSLYNGDRDQFGMEALTTLNLFMSENPDGIAVIFAGYKELMKYGVFRVQPGLPRRCMWHFECDGYDGDQLADIFYRQVLKDGWIIRKCDYLSIRKLICDNSDMFKSYGGDTERLVFYSQLEASRTNVMNSSYTGSSYNSSGNVSTNISSNNSNIGEETNDSEYRGKILTYEHVKCGLRRLGENNIDN